MGRRNRRRFVAAKRDRVMNALAVTDECLVWAQANGFTLDIRNDGLHWIIVDAERRFEWWPQTGTIWRVGKEPTPTIKVMSVAELQSLIMREARNQSLRECPMCGRALQGPVTRQ